jgi:hypothetical protein
MAGGRAPGGEARARSCRALPAPAVAGGPASARAACHGYAAGRLIRYTPIPPSPAARRGALPGRILREPLLHFLVAGALLHVAFVLSERLRAPDPHRIVVDESVLVPFLMGRNPQMPPDEAAAYLSRLDGAALDAVVDAYVREEVLVREAMALGLGENDAVARRRLVMQLDYINEGFITETTTVSAGQLEDWYEAHAADYLEPPRVTFTHVFLDARRRPPGTLDAEAAAMLARLEASAVPFHQAVQHGDRFLYQANYVESTEEEIASHFGSAFASAVFEGAAGTRAAGTADEPRWRGPYRSEHGLHLVMVTSLQAARMPPLSEARQAVERDLLAARLRDAKERFYEVARARYEVRLGVGGRAP